MEMHPQLTLGSHTYLIVRKRFESLRTCINARPFFEICLKQTPFKRIVKPRLKVNIPFRFSGKIVLVILRLLSGALAR